MECLSVCVCLMCPCDSIETVGSCQESHGTDAGSSVPPVRRRMLVCLRAGDIDLSPGWGGLCEVSPCEVTRRLWTRTQSLSSHWICWCLDLGLSASRTMRNTFLLFKSPCLWHFCYSSSNRLRQCSINTFEWIKKWAESETAEMGNRSWSKRSGLFQLLFFVVTLSCWMFLPTIHWMTGGINNKKKVWSPIHEEQGILCSCSSLYFPSCSPQRGPCSRPPTLPAFCGDQAWALQSYPGLTSGSYWNDLPTMRETQVQSLGWKDPLEKGMATYSSTLA